MSNTFNNTPNTKPDLIPEEEWPVGKWIILPGMKGELVAEQFESYAMYEAVRYSYNIDIKFFATEVEAWEHEYKKRTDPSVLDNTIGKSRLETVIESIKRLNGTIPYHKPRPLSLCAYKGDWGNWDNFNKQRQELRDGILTESGGNFCFRGGVRELVLRRPQIYVCFGEIPNMLGHGHFKLEHGGFQTFYHMSDFRELTEDEV